MRRFYLVRASDVSGVSGLGVVAEGVHFADGSAVVHWRTQFAGHEVYSSLKKVVGCHGHDGKTQLVWVDEVSSERASVPIPVKTFGLELFIKSGAVHSLSEYQFRQPATSPLAASGDGRPIEPE